MILHRDGKISGVRALSGTFTLVAGRRLRSLKSLGQALDQIPALPQAAETQKLVRLAPAGECE
ncbi:hypothetical protein [Roseibium sp.]|uniref:hypothetical protein n=1 Tax=Roseibium sp. TaxID=1936156 RepID=UPI003D09C69C